MSRQRLNTVAFGGMVAGRKEMNASFARHVHRGFGDFATDEGIEAQCSGSINIRLRGTRAPTDAADFVFAAGDELRRAPEHCSNMCLKCCSGPGLRQRAITGDVWPNAWPTSATEPPLDGNVQQCTQLRVIAQFRVRIQRQMVCKQTDVGTQQTRQPAPFHSSHTGILALPEIAMMHQQRIGPGRDRGINQRLTGSDTAHQFAYFTATLDLQPIRAIVLEVVDIQQLIGVTGQFVEINHDDLFVAKLRRTCHAEQGNPIMVFRKLITFLFQTITVGLVAAAVLLLLKPDLFRNEPAIVEVREHQNSAPASIPASIKGDWSGPVSYADAVERAAPAVVNVYTAKLITQQAHPLLNDPLFQYFFGDTYSGDRQRLQTSLGSGVILSAQGYVLTNNHVVANADQIQVMISDGRSLQATVVGVDPDTDLAVLKIEADALPSIIVGNSNQLRVGDVVLAIGNPFGVGQTVTQGIVSATGRNQLGINTFENFIQTDAAINPGNSGGALINAHGELIGINTAIFSKSGGSQGIGFAIPESLAKGVMKQIIEHGEVVRGWLGIEAQDLTPALAKSFGIDLTQGVLIAGVLRGGPAEQAGLQPGDIVTELDDQTVNNARDSMNRIAEHAPGSTLKLRGLRDGKAFTAEASIGRRPAAQ